LRVHLCGVRGSTPAPGADFVRYGGQTSCVAIERDDDTAPSLVLDAGGGLSAVTRLLDGAPFIGTILLTHLHWDHTLGLPFFAAADDPDANVAVVLPEQEDGTDPVCALAGMMSPPYFPIEPTDLRGSWTFDSIAPGTREIEGFEVLAREIPHKGGRTFGYRIGDGRSTFTYMPDHCPTVLGPGEHGFGEYHPVAIELARDADLLLHDALLFPEELAAEAEFGHAVGEYAIELAKRAGTREVVLFHHRHDRTDAALDGLARRLGGGDSPAVTVAAEGLVFEL
jgi:phosphoribosyl 1,2-cyclic phosphodiesterase